MMQIAAGRVLAKARFGPASRRFASAAARDMGIVDTVTGDRVTIQGLKSAAPNSLLTFGSGAAGLVTDVLRGGAARVAVISGSPAARETVVVEHARALFPASLALAGRVVDPLGQPLDGLGPVGGLADPATSAPPSGAAAGAAGSAATAQAHVAPATAVSWVPITETCSPGIAERAPLRHTYATGIKVLDAFYAIKQGTAVALVGERGAGKRRLALEVLQAVAAESRERCAAVAAANSAGGAGANAAAEGHGDAGAASGVDLSSPARPVHLIYCAVGLSVGALNEALITLRLSGAMAHTTVIAAPASSHVGSQFLGPLAASALADYLARVHGRDVLVVQDGLTAHATAARRVAGLAWAQASATASASLAPALFDRCCQLSESAGGGSVTALALLDSVPGAASAAAASLTADLSRWGSRRGGVAGAAEASGAAGAASAAAAVTRESVKQQEYVHHLMGLADAVIELDAAAAGAEARRGGGGAHPSGSGSGGGAAAGSGHASSGVALSAVPDSEAASAILPAFAHPSATGTPLPIPFDGIALRHAGHAAQGDALRHYAARAAVVLAQLREAATAARAASELGLEHESDADALLDLHAKARALLMPASGAAAGAGVGSGAGVAAAVGAAAAGSGQGPTAAAAPLPLAVAQPAVGAPAAPMPPPASVPASGPASAVSAASAAGASPAAVAASAVASPATALPASVASSVPDDQRRAMEALLAKRARDRQAKSAAALAASAGFAIRGPPGGGTAPSVAAATQAANLQASAAAASAAEALSPAAAHVGTLTPSAVSSSGAAALPSAAGAAAAPGAAGVDVPSAPSAAAAPARPSSTPKFRPPEGRTPPAQTFAPVATAVPLFGVPTVPASPSSAAAGAPSGNGAGVAAVAGDALQLSRRWRQLQCGSAFDRPSAPSSAEGAMHASGDSSAADDATSAAGVAAGAPGSTAAPAAAAGAADASDRSDAWAAPQHGDAARTLLSLFLLSHGYVQRVPRSRLLAYERQLYGLLTRTPGPDPATGSPAHAAPWIAEGSAFSALAAGASAGDAGTAAGSSGSAAPSAAPGAGGIEDEDEEEAAARRPTPAWGSAALPNVERGPHFSVWARHLPAARSPSAHFTPAAAAALDSTVAHGSGARGDMTGKADNAAAPAPSVRGAPDSAAAIVSPDAASGADVGSAPQGAAAAPPRRRVLSLLDAALLQPLPQDSPLHTSLYRVDAAAQLRQATVRLAAAAARGSLRQPRRPRPSEGEEASVEESTEVEADTAGSTGGKARSGGGGFISWLMGKTLSPSSSSKQAKGAGAAASSKQQPRSPPQAQQSARHYDVYATMAAPAPGDSSSRPEGVRQQSDAASTSAAQAGGSASGALGAAAEAGQEEGAVDPLAPVRGHLRLDPGVPLEALPPVWRAMHVTVAEFTRRFCGEPPLRE